MVEEGDGVMDLKYEIHLVAEKIALKKYGKEFYDLSKYQLQARWS